MKRTKLLMSFIFLLVFVPRLKGQNINTFAGTGVNGFSGDGGACNIAQLNNPSGVAVDASGNVYIVDSYNNRIRKVNTSGIISTFAGTGVAGFSGDGGAATSAQLNFPFGIGVDGIGNVYIADYLNNRIRKINTSGIMSTVAGTTIAGFSGDGGIAIGAQLNGPTGVTADGTGNIFISDYGNDRVRKVNTSGIISTFAGTGVNGFSGDGGAANVAQLNGPDAVATDAIGNVYITDGTNHRIRKVNTSGIISTYAGSGISGFSGDGGAATIAQLNVPTGVTIDALGNMYIVDQNNNRIRKVNTSGIISTFAGSGIAGFSGDGGLATNAQLNGPYGIAINGAGSTVYIVDANNKRIREVCSGNCALSINALSENNNKTLIYPNPNNGSFKIQSDFENAEMILFNSVGQKVYGQKIDQGINDINTVGLSQGLYHYTLLQNNVPTNSGNVTLE